MPGEPKPRIRWWQTDKSEEVVLRIMKEWANKNPVNGGIGVVRILTEEERLKSIAKTLERLALPSF